MGCIVGERLVEGPVDAVVRVQLDGRETLARLTDESPPVRVVRRLEHELALRGELDPAWAILPSELIPIGTRQALILSPFEGLPRGTGGPMALAEGLALAEALAGALEGLHRARLVHAELQPDVVFVDAAGGVRLTGFGGATWLPERAPVLATGELPPSLAWMAPEQSGRTRWPIDERTDLYNFGLLLYTWLAGGHPLAAEDALGWLHAHLARVPVPLVRAAPGTPPVVSALVDRLLEKDPERRYQSARGVRADLAHCRAALAEARQVHAFRLGRHDQSGRLRLPDGLFGRDRERAALTDAWDEARAGRGPLLVGVRGYAGIGKSSLVRELAEPVETSGGGWVEGKFNALQQDIPYATLARALDARVRWLLGLPEGVVEAWRARIRAALGTGGRVVTELVPALERLIGPQPPAPALAMTDSERRTLALLGRFVAACAPREAPLALFLDDMQWADQASQRGVKQVLDANEGEGLLLVCAWRDNEVPERHPWAVTLAGIRQGGAKVREVTLGPLSPSDVGRLVASMLGSSERRVRRLTDVIYERTRGNPFFAIQMMVSLQQDGRLRVDGTTGRWTWEDTRVREAPYADNVADVLEGAIARLPTRALQVTRLAACVGDRGDLPSLAALHGHGVEATGADLRPAVREGLVLRREDQWRFLHDRVRQAAYQSMDARERARTHLAIGRRSLVTLDAQAVEARIFDVVTQFNLGRTAMDDPEERHRVAALNLCAGRRARAAAAWQCATAYLEAGVEHLGEDPWAKDPALVFSLELERARCEWLSGLLEAAERRLLGLLTRAQSRADAARVYGILPSLQWMRGAYATSVRTAVEGLATLGVVLSPHPDAEAVREELAALDEALAGQSIEALAELPEMTDPVAVAATEMLAELYAPAYITDTGLMCVVSARLVALSLRHGNADTSPMGYAALGRALGPLFGRYQEGARFGRLAWDLVERKGRVAWKGRIADLYGISSAFWVEPLRGGVAWSRIALQAATEVGDVSYACWACAHLCHFLLASGAPLEEVRSELDARMVYVRRAGFGEPLDLLVGLGACVDALRGDTAALSSWTGGNVQEQAFFERIERERAPLSLVWHHTWRCATYVIAGRGAEAVAAAERALPHFWSEDPRATAGCRTQLVYAELHPWLALAATLRWGDAPLSERARLERYLMGCEARLAEWATHAPDNFAHRLDLLRAERARIEGRVGDAIRAFDAAVSGAARQGFAHHEALACEAAARFYEAQGAAESAQAWLARARDAWSRWGASGKVRQLEASFPNLRRRQVVPLVASAREFDVLAVVKATQVIAREIDLSRVEDALLRVVLEQTAAQRVYLLLADGEAVRVDAVAASGVPARARLAEAPEAHPNLDVALVRLVLRTGETVALGEGPTVRGVPPSPSRALSVVCVPIVRQGRVVAALYAENDLTPGAFPPARIAVTEALAAQAAISLELATLYERLRVTNAELERRVEERTRDLAAANAELSAFSYSVSHDLRAPLRAIHGFASLLSTQHGENLPPDGVALLARLRAAATRMSALIDDLLHLSRVTRAELAPAQLDLTGMAQEILDALRAADPTRVVEVQIQADLSARADARLLRVALENLLGNAWKYSRTRTPARIEVGATEAGAFFVRDNGAGFDPAYAARLFQPFQRLHSDREFEGTGVGLATAARVIQRHGGRIWAEGAVDRGATFFFTLG
jgi:predicted ATPase/signal transduction histidine kinase